MLRPCASTSKFYQMKTFLVSPKFNYNIVRAVGSRPDKGGGSSSQPFKSVGSAREAQYFKKREKELLTNLKDEMKDQISFHEEQIAIHKAVIEKLKKKQKDMTEE